MHVRSFLKATQRPVLNRVREPSAAVGSSVLQGLRWLRQEWGPAASAADPHLAQRLDPPIRNRRVLSCFQGSAVFDPSSRFRGKNPPLIRVDAGEGRTTAGVGRTTPRTTPAHHARLTPRVKEKHVTLASPTAPTSRPFWIIDALNAEWDQLSGLREPVNQWRGAHPDLAGCACVADVLGAVATDADRVLAALIEETAGGDVLAGRVVLQAMLGKVVNMARQDRHASVDSYVAAMWCRIATYPLRDRPRSIAANLALDVLKTVQRETRWSRSGSEVALVSSVESMDYLHHRSVARNGLDPAEQVSSLTAAGVIQLAAEMGLVDTPSREVLTTVYAEGLSGRDAAARHRTSPAMIRYRCSRAVRRMHQHSSALVEAA